MHMLRNRAPRAAIVGLLLAIAAAALFAACSGGEEPTPPPSPTVAPLPTAAPAPTSPPPTPASDGATVTVGEGTVARYLIGEQLARNSLPNDAIGETSDVSGKIVFDASGGVDASSSTLAVGMSGFVSDSDRRDGWVQRQFRSDAELAVTSVEGLDWPLPQNGEASFRIVGDLTIEGVSSATTWDATASFENGSANGVAKTVITFDQFELSKPTFAFILSVEDDIRLEIDISAAVE